jgi:cytochrome c oxidase assembly protein subunit 15
VSSSPRSSADVAARRAAWLFAGLTAATFCLIVLGALVRAHGAGLACPDWPLCFGQLIPAFDFRVAFEWGHRLLAGGVALGFAAGAALVVRHRELRAAAGATLLIGGVLLAAQIVLGGLTVLLGLAPWTVTAHLLFGNAFCASQLWLARTLFERSRVSPPQRDSLTGAAAVWVALTATLLLVQVTLGGLVSSHYAGLACSTFPTCDGTSLAPSLSGLVGLHVIHRLNGYALVAAWAGLAWLTRHSGVIGTLSRSGLRLVLLQVAVGVANVLLRLPVEVTALHSALGAALVLTTLLLVREAIRSRAVLRAPTVPAAGDQALEVG